MWTILALACADPPGPRRESALDTGASTADTAHSPECGVIAHLPFEAEVYYAIEYIRFSVADPSVYTFDTDIPGHAELGDDVGWTQLYWVLDAPLVPQTTYTIALRSDVCDDAVESFTTSAYGLLVTDVAALAGHAWGFRVPSTGLYSDVNEVSSLFEAYVEDTTLSLTVASAAEDRLELVLGSLSWGEQDYCSPTPLAAEVPLVDGHAFTAELAGELWLETDRGERVIVVDPVIDADIHPDGDDLLGTFSGVLDARWMVDYAEDGASFCDEAARWDDICEACADGLPYCLPFELTLLGWDGVNTVVPVACADAAACEDAPPDPADCAG